MDETTTKAPESQEIVVHRNPLPAGAKVRGIIPTSFDDAFRIARAVVASGYAPRGMKKAEQAVIIIMRGLEIGLPPMTALSTISLIKGKPTLWGDGIPGLALASGLLEDVREWVTGKGDQRVWHCEVKRRGIPTPASTSFSIAQAKRARLWDDREEVERVDDNGNVTKGPNESAWHRYPERMMQMRCRIAFRDLFADVYGGLHITEEMIRDQSIEEVERGDAAELPSETWTTVDNPLSSKPQVVQAERQPRRERHLDPDEIIDEGFRRAIEAAEMEAKREADVSDQPMDTETPHERYWLDTDTGAAWATSGPITRPGGELGTDGTKEIAAEQYWAHLEAPAEPQDAPEPPEAPEEPPPPENAPAASASAASTASTAEADDPGLAYYQEVLATVANATHAEALNTWWRGQKITRSAHAMAGRISSAQLETMIRSYQDKYTKLMGGAL